MISIAHAQDAAVAATQAAPSPLSGIFPLLLIFVVFYFLLIRPQQKKYKQHQAMLGAIVKNDHVVTNGGIHGKVARVDDENATLIITIADGVDVVVSRAMVATRIAKSDVKKVKVPKASKETQSTSTKAAPAKKTPKKSTKKVANDN